MRLLRHIVVPLVVLVALGAAGYGLIGWGVAGICDTSCPSDPELRLYKAMFFGGAAIVIGVVVAVAISCGRRSR